MRWQVAHELPRRVRLRADAPLGARSQRELVEQALRAVRGVRSVRVDPATTSVLVLHDGVPGAREALTRALEAVDRGAAPPASPEGSRDELRARRRGLVASALWLVFGSAVPPVPRAAVTLLRALPFFGAAARELGRGELRAEVLDAAAIATAIRMGDFRTAGIISLLLGIGDYLRLRTEERARRELTATLVREERRVRVRRAGVEVEVGHRDVVVGDLVIVRAGHVVPVDGRVVSGQASVDQSSLTGESAPVERGTGSLVYEGTLVADGELQVEALQVGDATRLSRIVQLVHDAEEAKARAESRAHRLADRLVPYVFGAAGLTAAVTGQASRAASVLLVDYSCALKLAVPIAMKTSLAEGLRNGVLVRGGKFVEALASVDTVVFDKTGTLTHARPRVVAVHAFDGVDRATLLRDAACVEEHFPHPFAAAIQEEARRRGLFHRRELHGEVRYVVANGVESTVKDRRFLVGSRAFLARSGVAVDEDRAAALAAEGHSLVWAAVDDRVVGAFAIEDPLRPDVVRVLAALRALGVSRLVLLTGDSAANAARVARLGFDEVHAEVTPEQKAAVVERLQGAGRRVAMVGDGMNDAPALSKASVGVSFQHGSDLARESADVLVLRPELECLPQTILLAQRTMQRVAGNFRAIVGVNTALLALSAIGVIPPALSGALHNATTVATSARSLRRYVGPAG